MEKENRPLPRASGYRHMENKITTVSLYKPHIEDLWFREAMLADPETMRYNEPWGGTIPFPREAWAEWYDGWVARPDRCFYRYIATGRSRLFVGEAAWHYDGERDMYLADVLVFAKNRRQGYGTAGLELLCAAARKAGIPELYDDIAAGSPGITMFLRCGFSEESRTGESILLKKLLL